MSESENLLKISVNSELKRLPQALLFDRKTWLSFFDFKIYYVQDSVLKMSA